MKKILLLFGLGLILTSCSLVPKLDDIGGKNNKSTDVKVNTNLQKGDNAVVREEHAGLQGDTVYSSKEGFVIMVFDREAKPHNVKVNYISHDDSVFANLTKIVACIAMIAGLIALVMISLKQRRKRTCQKI